MIYLHKSVLFLCMQPLLHLVHHPQPSHLSVSHPQGEAGKNQTLVGTAIFFAGKMWWRQWPRGCDQFVNPWFLIDFRAGVYDIDLTLAYNDPAGVDPSDIENDLEEEVRCSVYFGVLFSNVHNVQSLFGSIQSPTFSVALASSSVIKHIWCHTFPCCVIHKYM